MWISCERDEEKDGKTEKMKFDNQSNKERTA